MTDEKILDLKTKKPFELVTGTEGTSDQKLITVIDRFRKYATEKKYTAIGIIMVDSEGSTITGWDMEAGTGMALAGGCSHLAFRINKHMDDDHND